MLKSSKEKQDSQSYPVHWVGYEGTDADGDGIGGTPYIINEYNTDPYPLIAPYNITVVISQELL